MFLITLYLIAIVIANLLIAQFGPGISIVTAFVLIGLDLTARDGLHDRWQGGNLWRNMVLLIAAGSLLSWFLNRNAGPVAIASFLAFSGAGLADTIVYILLGSRAQLVKVNGSNVVSAAVDSILFLGILSILTGQPISWLIIAGQFAAKVGGGFVWSLILTRRLASEPVAR